MKTGMGSLAGQAAGWLRDVLKILTSRERIRDFLNIPLYSNAFYLIVANGLSSLLGFVFWIVAARVYTTQEVGIASAAISAIGIVGMISHLGLGFGLIRFLPGIKNQAATVINACLALVTLVAIAVSLIYIAGIDLWSPALVEIRGSTLYIIAFVAFATVTALASIVDESTIASRRSAFVMGRALIFNGFKLALLPVMAYCLHSSGIFASWGLALIVSIMVALLFFLPRLYHGFFPYIGARLKPLKSLVRFSLGNYAAQFLMAAPGLILPLIVVNILGAEANAFFYIAWAISTAVIMIPTSISLSLFTEGSYDEDKLWSDFRKSLNVLSIILIPLVALGLVFADKLLVLYGGVYSESSTALLRWLLAALLPAAAVRVYYGVIMVQHRLVLLISLNLFIAIATLVTSYLLLPQMGIDSTGIAWLASNTVVLLWVMFGTGKRREAFRRLILKI